jgi:hypothetical protein
MPDIRQSLQGKDLQFLNNLAMIWGIELQTHDLRSVIQETANAMSDKEQILDIVEALDTDSKAALQALHTADGKIPWPLFVRKYGELRTMGAARREREQPNLHPINATEVLWYRGLLGKAFFNIQKEPQEYAYIPDEMNTILSAIMAPVVEKKTYGRPATSMEKKHIIPATDTILDHLTTFLSAIRTGHPLDTLPWLNQTIPVPFLTQLAGYAHLINNDGIIQSDQVRRFMEASRAEALYILFRSWVESPFNDLHHLPGLVFEGHWQNEPLETRQFLINELHQLPPKTWWSLPAFVESIRLHTPDFQRPAGDYDSWYIRQQNNQGYLRGIQYWDAIDGALLRLLITKHFHWLGIMDLACADTQTQPTAFRFSAWAEDMLSNRPPVMTTNETETVKILQDGLIQIPRSTSRAIRYQIARFSQMEKEDAWMYEYRIRPDSLAAAVKSGLKIEQFVSLIQRAGEKPIPPSVFALLENWKNHGLQASIAPAFLLTVDKPEILEHLMNSRAKKYLGEPLNATTILIQEKHQKLVMSILAELGYLSELQSATMVKMNKQGRR